MLIPELCYLTGTAALGPPSLPLLGAPPPLGKPFPLLQLLTLPLTLHHPVPQTLRRDPCLSNRPPFDILLEGLTDKMRNDFNVMKDLAVHTRLTPEQRQREVGRLIDYIHK